MLRSLFIALAGGLALGAPAAAQSTLTVGQPVDGVFGKSSPRLSDGSPYACYTLQTVRGRTYTVDLRSSAFDAYLGAGPGAGCNETDSLTDDDGAGGTDSRVTIPGDGSVWHIRANTLQPRESGPYRLTVTGPAERARAPQPAPQAPPRAPSRAGQAGLSLGKSVTGALTDQSNKLPDGSAFQCYPLSLSAGAEVRATLRSSAFDTYLALYDGDRCQGAAVMSDDDGAGGTDSQLTFTATARQAYSLAANSLTEAGRGRFTLSLEAADGSAASAPAQPVSSDYALAVGCLANAMMLIADDRQRVGEDLLATLVDSMTAFQAKAVAASSPRRTGDEVIDDALQVGVETMSDLTHAQLLQHQRTCSAR